MRYVLIPITYTVVQPDNADFYLRVNPDTFEVKRVRGGWKPLDKKRWLGQTPIKAKLIPRKVI